MDAIIDAKEHNFCARLYADDVSLFPTLAFPFP